MVGFDFNWFIGA